MQIYRSKTAEFSHYYPNVELLNVLITHQNGWGVLHRMGVGWNFPDIHKMRWGPGVVGRTSVVAVVAVLAILGALFVVREPSLVKVLVYAMIGMPLFFFALAFGFAFKHPEISVMEGAQALAYRQAEMSAKNVDIIDVTPRGSANTAPPKALSRLGGNDA